MNSLWHHTDSRASISLLPGGQFDVRYRRQPIATLQLAPDEFIQSDRHYTTDGGTIPPVAQCLPGFDRFGRTQGEALAYWQHDSCYRNGVYYFCDTLTGRYVKMTCTRREADEFLRVGLRAGGASRVRARVIWAFVRACGWKAWNRSRAAQNPR